MSISNEFTFKHNGKACNDLKNQQLDKGSVHGLNWTWSLNSEISANGTPKKLEKYVYFMFNFEWEELKKAGVIGFEGCVTTSFCKCCIPNQSGIELTESGRTIELRVNTFDATKNHDRKHHFSFEFAFTPVSFASFARKFPASNVTDAVLVVEGVEMYVNRAFLAVHSEFFYTMFNSDFKEKSMQKIPIEAVHFKDFARLVGILLPICDFINDNEIEMMLELADRFMMPSVVHRVQHHLMTVSQLPYSKILGIADKHKLENVIAHCMLLIATGAQLKAIKLSPFYEKLALTTKLKLFDLVVKFL